MGFGPNSEPTAHATFCQNHEDREGSLTFTNISSELLQYAVLMRLKLFQKIDDTSRNSFSADYYIMNISGCVSPSLSE